MGDTQPHQGAPLGLPEPDVFLLPFAVPEPIDFANVDAGILARRLPDFVHQILNGVSGNQVGMLEIQSPPGDGPPSWVTLGAPPEPDEIFMMFGGPESVRAVVTGSMRQLGDSLLVDLNVHLSAGSELPQVIHCEILPENPARSLLIIARILARTLDLQFPEPSPGLLTSSAGAFFKYLEGLDGAALLGTDGFTSHQESPDGEQLVQPLAEALQLDPQFGMALRTAAMTVFVALEGDQFAEAGCFRLLDRCFDSMPTDGDGCVVVAEQLAHLGDDKRAMAWLQHAAGLEPPAPRALENLGVMRANGGDLIAARDLWLRGVASDGHPDFFAHLARLGFSEGMESEAWDKVLRGLRRQFERAARAAEWPGELRTGSVLLRYLAEHLEEKRAPEDVVEALLDLVGMLVEPSEQVDLGLCLLRVGRMEEAEAVLRSGLQDPLEDEVHDRAVRALLNIEIGDFEKRFAAASDKATEGRDPRSALTEMQHYLDLQPSFWPALFFAGVALRRLGQGDDALDLMAEVLERRPGQGDALVEMSRLFDERGNPKRALECIDEAVLLDPTQAELHVIRATYLEHLDRRVEAANSLRRAIELDPNEPDHHRRWRRLAAS